MPKASSTYLLILYVLLWALTAEGTYGQQLHLKFDQLTVDNGLPQNSVYSIAKDKYGFMWFGTWGGAVRYDGYNVQVFRANEKDSTALSDNRISGITTDSLDNIWIEVEPRGELFKYDYKTESFQKAEKEQVPDYLRDKLIKRYGYHTKYASNQQFEWQTSDYGLIQINKTTHDTLVYHADVRNPMSLSDNLLKDVYLDDSGHLWVGTQSGGVDHADLYDKAFRNYYKGRRGEGLIDNVARAMCLDRAGRLWIGSENQGITILSPDSADPQYRYVDSKHLTDLRIRAIFCDSKGTVWIGTKKGLFYYEPNKKTFTQCTMDMCHPSVFAITEDQNGTIWVGTFFGLAKYDQAADKFHCIFKEDGLAGNQIMDLMVDQKGKLWAATEDGGVSCIRPPLADSKELEITNYTHQTSDTNGLLSNRIFSLTEDSNGYIWAASDAGLNAILPDRQSIQHYSTQNGLIDDLIMAVAFDGEHSIWASHTKGLSRLDLSTQKIQHFNRKDGLQGNEFKQSAVFKNPSDNKLYFGGSNGLTTFIPSHIKTNPNPPKMVLTRLSVMHQELNIGTKVRNRAILKSSLQATDEITLTWWDKSFQVEFAAIHFSNPLSNKYKYILEGYDDEWITTDATRRIASYANLPAGKYIFKVMGANSDGVWSKTPATLHIVMLSPWWLSWWAICLYLMAAGCVVWLVYRYLDSKIQLRKKEAIHQSKLQFFTEISHEFRTPLTLIIDPLERLIHEKPKKQLAEYYYQLMRNNAQQLLMLVNQLLDFRKLEAGKLQLRLEQTDMVAFVKKTVASFEHLAEKQDILLSIETSIPSHPLFFDQDKITMVLNNLLSNALKYTPRKGKVQVAIHPSTHSKKGVFIEVKDTGPGIPKSEQEKVFEIFYQVKNGKPKSEGSGIGLALTRELIALHGGKISLESHLGKGTKLGFFLPDTPSPSNEPASSPMPVDDLQPFPAPAEQNTPSPHRNNIPVLLVVDDNEEIRNYIVKHFQDHFAVSTAANGEEGMSKAFDQIPDLIISDVMMPDMDGLQLCRQLKADMRTSHIPIILLTARQSDTAKTEGYGMGADSYVTKPFSTQVLMARVKNLLEQRSHLQAKFSAGDTKALDTFGSNPVDKTFLENARQYIEAHLDSEDLDVDSLAQSLNMSRPQFYRKIKGLTDKSAAEFITSFRMEKASSLLLSGEFNVSETAYKVGYNLPNNFSRAFIKHFGLSPSQYIKKKNNRS
ncbi:hybrid sensor histidine kinase/response regulator transcription factor [Echinicola rosea]|uniref:histidine kinase n=2 Tax=Echinicola rosea TaxID=1807691 RepID=A0ABQ1UNB9_9BACT|nr:hybrid sensor histidine kinase/response regulator transcription factor [Echinicola rosea]GGF23197.1 hybrid sensor histidine kinase/response regulator [Echinicola rosea]